ncbi:hypothetical protein EXW49_27575 (plasmid) [Bacillus mycoides]|nr:hypothetical protein EXW49_27575 [Bacillus mycoides]
MFIQEEGGHLEWGNDHVNILETYNGIEWIREIEERICRRYKYSKAIIINFVSLVHESQREGVEQNKFIKRIEEIQVESLKDGKGVIVHTDNFVWMMEAIKFLSSGETKS